MADKPGTHCFEGILHGHRAARVPRFFSTGEDLVFLDSYSNDAMVDDPVPALPAAAATGRRFSLEIVRDLGSAEQTWRAFELRALSHPFQSFDWLSTWYETVGAARGSEPFIVIARDVDGQVFLIAPMAFENSLLGRCLVWLGQSECDYNAPLVRPDAMLWLTPRAVEVLWRAIIRAAGKCDYAELAKQAPMLGGYDNPFASLSTVGHTCSTHMTRLWGPWDKFYSDKRGAKSRQRLRSKLKKLENQGPVKVRFAEGGAERRRIVSWLVDCKHAQLSADGVSNVFAEGNFRTFLDVLAGYRIDADRLVVAALDVAGEPAAACLGLIHNRRFYYVSAAYDAARYGRYSPGQHLLLKVMEKAVNEGCNWFDFTIGDEGYKADWCDVSMDISNGLVPFTVRGHVAIAVLSVAIRVKATLKAHPVLFSLSRRTRLALRKIFLGPDPVREPADREVSAPRPQAGKEPVSS